MQNTKNSNINYQDCGFNYTIELISGKYKMSVLYCLYKDSIVRYNELKRILSPISFKTLTNILRELEDNDLIKRREYPQIPPKVEYSLSARGKTPIPLLDELCKWGEANKDCIKSERNERMRENRRVFAYVFKCLFVRFCIIDRLPRW